MVRLELRSKVEVRSYLKESFRFDGFGLSAYLLMRHHLNINLFVVKDCAILYKVEV